MPVLLYEGGLSHFLNFPEHIKEKSIPPQTAGPQCVQCPLTGAQETVGCKAGTREVLGVTGERAH